MEEILRTEINIKYYIRP